MIIALVGCTTNMPGGHDADTNAEKTDGYDLNTSYSTELNTVRSQLRSTGDEGKLGSSILEDGVVTERELNELKEQYDQCFIDHGYDPGSFDFDKTGAGSVYPPSGLSEEERSTWGERTNEVQQTCDQRNGTAAIRGLVDSVQMNPDNKDIRKTIIACLIEKGLVDKGYTVNDYDTDLANGSGPSPRRTTTMPTTRTVFVNANPEPPHHPSISTPFASEPTRRHLRHSSSDGPTAVE